MRTKVVLGAVLFLAAWGRVQASPRQLQVYLKQSHTVNFSMLAAARNITREILGGAGVRVNWKIGEPAKRDAGTAVAVAFDSGAPSGFHRCALGYALPFGQGGVTIHVLFNRVLALDSHNLATVVLGHVLAHEIGHVLERIDRHSSAGVMKARWESRDYDDMLRHPLAFASEDVDLIQAYWRAK